jgi:hypothetical protein
MEQLIRHVNYCNILLYDAWNLRTYHFWAFGEKHLPFFSCFIKKETPPLVSPIKTYFLKFASCLITFSFTKELPKICFVFNLFCCCCDMMYDVMLCGMIWWYDAKWWWCRRHTHALTLEHTRLCIPLGTSFESFKLCIPLGTTFELLHLLFWWHLSSASP